MEKRNGDGELVNQKLRALEVENLKTHAQIYQIDKELQLAKHEITRQKKKFELQKEDTDFFHKSALENKRKLKLTKVALKRMEVEYANLLLK